MDEAKQAIDQINQILQDGLANTIQQPKNQGSVLSEPTVWDGALAIDFRSNVWPATAALDNAHQKLQELQIHLNAIHGNIFEAGGNHA
jgi:hypothetical protein